MTVGEANVRASRGSWLEGDRGWWRPVRWVGVAGTFILLGGLFKTPKITLDLWWNLVIPLLPASFLVSSALWRGVCPLASFNTVGNGLFSKRALTSRGVEIAGLIGIVLLALLVPARRFVFNTDGAVLAGVIIAVLAAAFALGTVFDLKVGFCNSLCPVLPVERLYGQRPLVNVGNPRCATCTMCTGKGCLDLSPEKSIAQILGSTRRNFSWMNKSFGVFAATFPGAVFSYFSLTDGSWSSAPSVYGSIAVGASVSYVLTQLIVRVFRLPAGVTIAGLAGLAVGFYYWFAAPTIAETVGVNNGMMFRLVFLGLVVGWTWRALKIELKKSARTVR